MYFNVVCYGRKRSCGKVTFLHLSVSHSVHRKGVESLHGVTSCLAAWSHVPSGGGPLSWRGLCLGGSLSRGVSVPRSLSRGVSVWGSLSGRSPQKEHGTRDRDPPGQRPLDRNPLGQRPPPLYGKEQAVCILLECILVVQIEFSIHPSESACSTLEIMYIATLRCVFVADGGFTR